MPVAKSQHKVKIIINALHVPRSEPIYFSPIITEFTDAWSPRWNSINVHGRNDPIPFYNGTGRQLTLGFRVISDSTAEAMENMRKISQVAQYQYGVYTTPGGMATNSSTKRLKSSPYFSFKLLNVVGGSTELQGYINGPVNINPGFQSKSQTQYFFRDKILFSDVNIVLRIQVMHEKPIGHYMGSTSGTGTQFIESAQDSYPYGVLGTTMGNIDIGNGSSPVAPPTVESLNYASVKPTDNDLDYLIKTQNHKKNLADNGAVDNAINILKPQT